LAAKIPERDTGERCAAPATAPGDSSFRSDDLVFRLFSALTATGTDLAVADSFNDEAVAFETINTREKRRIFKMQQRD
jgi:hypothetical protein